MSKSKLGGSASLFAVMSVGMFGGSALFSAALAQGAAPAPSASSEDIVITGSYIRGTPEDAALPVDVMTSKELERQGSPSTVQLVKTIPSATAAYGEANQFGAGRTEGSSSINLRGLGQSRTLVLINGKRMVNSAAGTNPFVDLNAIAPSAIGRLEVLKDGAAATYGSDAIGGVVNIITKKNQNGFNVGGEYTFVDGSDGDYNAHGDWGFSGGNGSVFVTINDFHRSQLRATERDFVTPKFSDNAGAALANAYNPQGGWSAAANPGTYLSPAFAAMVDPACGTAWSGEYLTSGGSCLFRYADFDNLVEDTDILSGFGSIDVNLTDDTKFHVEGLYANADITGVVQSVTYGPNQYPTATGFGSTTAGAITVPGALPGVFSIPTTNPGWQALMTQFPTFASSAEATAANTAGFLYAHPFFFRPMAMGGNPLFGGGGQQGTRLNETFRISSDLSGSFTDNIHWDLGATLSQSRATQTTPDFLVDRLQLALRGFGSLAGGPTCDYKVPANAGNNAAGCYYFNPFSSSIVKNAISGAANPNVPTANLINSAALVDWIYGPNPQGTQQTNRQWVVDAVVNGETSLEFPGGPISWATGYQWRRDTFDFDPSQFADNLEMPCIDSDPVINGPPTCSVRNGPYTFYGNYTPVLYKTDTHAEFIELDLPLLDNLTTQIAVRHEQSDAGEVTIPKISGKFQLFDGLAFRASAGKTYRAPPAQLLTGQVTGLAATTLLNGTTATSTSTSYKPYDTFGNANLEPEKANAYNAGVIVKAGGFEATVDFWKFEFANPLTVESGLQMVGAMFPLTGTFGNTTGHCGDAAYAALQARMTFNGVCSSTNLVRTKTFNINGAGVDTDGIDVSVKYTFDDVFGGSLNLGADATKTMHYKVGDQVVEGITTLRAYDAAGKLNYLLGPNSIPDWKGNAFIEFNNGGSNLRWTTHYIGEMADQRANITGKGKTVDSWLTHDIAFRQELPWDTVLTAAILNVTDEDPPFARLDYSYDPFTANPLGRISKIGLNKKF